MSCTPIAAPPSLYLNIPTSDPEASLLFYTAIGFELIKQYTDGETKSFRLPAPNNMVCVMVHGHKRFKEFMRPGTDIPDATKATEVLISLAVDKKEAVDEWVAKVVAAGGTADPYTLEGYGQGINMYTRSFADLDGHIWETVAMLKAPEEKKE
jgi:uncharacterized protein